MQAQSGWRSSFLTASHNSNLKIIWNIYPDRYAYDLTALRDTTEIACSCGNLFIVQYADSKDGRIGRRKIDQEFYLRQMELHGLIDQSRLIHSSIHDLDMLLSLIIQHDLKKLEEDSVTGGCRRYYSPLEKFHPKKPYPCNDWL